MLYALIHGHQMPSTLQENARYTNPGLYTLSSVYSLEAVNLSDLSDSLSLKQRKLILFQLTLEYCSNLFLFVISHRLQYM